MRLDRYFKEQRRLRSDSPKQKLLVIGIVLGIHLFAAAGWTAWAAYRERNAPPRQVITYFDIAPLPAAPVAAPAEAEKVVEALKEPEPAPEPAPAPEQPPEQPSDPAPAAPQQP